MSTRPSSGFRGKLAFWAIAFALAAPWSLAATADDLIKGALDAEKRFDPRAALSLLQQADELRPNDPFILQRISREYSDSMNGAASNEEQRKLAEQALVYSKRAYELDAKNPINVLSLAICYGKISLYGDNSSRVESCRLIKKYAEDALSLDPNYDWAHHVLGRWHYELAEIGGAKRFFAKVLYGGLPPASFEDALSHLRRAVELSPQTVSHHIELGFALSAAGREKDARVEFERGLALPSTEIHDETAKERARKAMSGAKAR